MQTQDNNHEDVQKDQTQDIKTKSDCETELKHTKDLLLRLNADFENYKKRTNKEKISWILDAQAQIIGDLLPIIDDFDRAIQASLSASSDTVSEYKKKEQREDLQVWVTGFELIHKSFQKFLEKNGIKEISDFSNFDPEYHEAIAQIESEKESGTIIDIVQKGYILGDKILRPAKVTVSK